MCIVAGKEEQEREREREGEGGEVNTLFFLSFFSLSQEEKKKI